MFNVSLNPVCLFEHVGLFIKKVIRNSLLKEHSNYVDIPVISHIIPFWKTEFL